MADVQNVAAPTDFIIAANMLLTKTNSQEFYKEFRKNYPKPAHRVIAPPDPVRMAALISQPMWWEGMAKQAKIARKERYALLRKTQPWLKKIFQFVDENDLIYTKMGDYQHRVTNADTNKFVDWWDGKKQSMRCINGMIEWQGEHQIKLHQELANLL